MASILAAFATVNAAPIRFDQVTQVINARPEKAATTSIMQLRITGDYNFLFGDDDDKKGQPAKPQNDRVITETRSDIIKDDVCDCTEAVVASHGFPKWALLGLAAIPIAFLITHDDDNPSRTPTRTPTGTPSPSTGTPTPHTTPSMTPTPKTPMPSPTPPPPPVPEPVTILLFGTGLASIGLAARRKYGKKDGKKEK